MGKPVSMADAVSMFHVYEFDGLTPFLGLTPVSRFDGLTPFLGFMG